MPLPEDPIEIGAILALLLAVSPVLKSLGDGLSSWINARQSTKADLADKLSQNSLEWVERFSKELQAAKDRIAALEADNETKNSRIDALEQENNALRMMISDRDKRIDEMQKEINRLQRSKKDRGMLND